MVTQVTESDSVLEDDGHKYIFVDITSTVYFSLFKPVHIHSQQRSERLQTRLLTTLAVVGW